MKTRNNGACRVTVMCWISLEGKKNVANTVAFSQPEEEVLRLHFPAEEVTELCLGDCSPRSLNPALVPLSIVVFG